MLRSISKTEVCKPRCRYKIFYAASNYFVSVSAVRFKSHYNTLGLNSKATPEEIKSAYYKLSFKFHPDKNEGSEHSAAKFREISEAYEVLGNSEKKEKYDQEQVQSQQEKYNDVYQHGFNSQTLRKKHPHVYTGKTSYYDFDSHYREHYERYYEMKRGRTEYRYRDMRRRQVYPPFLGVRRFMMLWLFLIVFSQIIGVFTTTFPNSRQIVYYNSEKGTKENNKN